MTALGIRRRSRRRRSKRRREQLRALSELTARGLSLRVAAQAVAVHPTTLRRWRRRQRRGEPLARVRGPSRSQPTPAQRVAASDLVRATHGLVGAASLSHSVPALSRRAAAEVKHDICRDMERERRAAAARVQLARPGLLRGLDSMELCQPGSSRRHLLVACDGQVPFRTSWRAAERYDARTVMGFLEQDIDAHGAPIILRMDRAKQHTTPVIEGFLRERGVLVLQGPPHYAPYYGQLERQNREHRAWLEADAADQDIERMVRVLNGVWRRSTLGWLTAAEAWAKRPLLCVDRQGLREEVLEKSARLRSKLNLAGGASSDLAWRIAVKQVLIRRGFLKVTQGGWC